MSATRLTAPAWLLTAAFFAIAVLLQCIPDRISSQSFTLGPGGYLHAQYGDDLVLGSSCAGSASLSAGREAWATRFVVAGDTATWRSTSSDQFRLAAPAGCVVDVVVRRHVPAVDPLFSGLFFLLAAAGTFALAALLVPAGIGRASEPFPWIFAAIVAAAALTLFLCVPSYHHADAAAEALRRNWGLHGAGYYDTIAEIAHRFRTGGILGLSQVESYGKPILMPLLGYLLGFGRSPYAAGPIESAVLMALATSGLAVYARFAGGKSAGVAAATLFAVNPVVVAYSTSFYPECALLAGVTWAAVFGHVGLARQNRRFLVAALACAALGASAMNLAAVPLVVLSACALLLAAGNALDRVARFGLAATCAASVSSVALWPFLWHDAVDRMGYVFGMLLGTPDRLWDRWESAAGIAGLGFIQHLTPLEIVLLLVSILLVGPSRQRPMATLFAGFIGVFAFTSLLPAFAQQDVLYGVPFLALLCTECFAVDPAAAPEAPSLSRVRVAAIGAIALVGAGWAAAFYPYVGMARLFCVTPACSLAGFGAAEPGYGYKQVAAWIRDHASQDDVIVASSAPHVLQAYLPAQHVLERDAALEELRPRFVVVAPDSPVYAQDAVSQSLELVLAEPARLGGVRVYRWTGDARSAPPDIEASELARILPDPRMRVVVIGATVRDARALPELIQVPNVGRSAASAATVGDLGSAVVVLPDDSSAGRELSARGARIGSIGAYGVFNSPDGLLAGSKVGAHWDPENELRSVVPPSSELATAFRLDVRIWNGAPAPATASAECGAAERIDAPLYRVAPDRAVATFSALDPAIRKCLWRAAPLVFRTAAFPRFGTAEGQVVALRYASPAPIALRVEPAQMEAASSERPSPAPAASPTPGEAPTATMSPTPAATISPTPMAPAPAKPTATLLPAASATTSPTPGPSAATMSPTRGTAALKVPSVPRAAAAAVAPALVLAPRASRAVATAIPEAPRWTPRHVATPAPNPAELELRREEWLRKRAAWIAKRDALIREQEAEHELKRQAWLAKRAAWIAKRDALKREQEAERERKRRAWLQKQAAAQ